jgi:hypothetical protein
MGRLSRALRCWTRDGARAQVVHPYAGTDAVMGMVVVELLGDLRVSVRLPGEVQEKARVTILEKKRQAEGMKYLLLYWYE